MPGVIDRTWAAVARGHLLPLALLGLLDLMLLRQLLFTNGVPASMDSGFLYSRLPLFDRYGMTGFSVWLPDSFGQVQQYSIYWLLAAFNGVFHNPVAVYKGAVLATVVVASCSSYGLAYWLSDSRLAATIASGLYVFSPFSVSIWLVGHLDVGISYAVGPLALWALWAALRSGRTAPMVGLGLAGSALFLLTTGQGIYWLLPMGLIAAFELTSQSRAHHSRVVLRRVALTAGVSALVFVLASAVQLIPYAAGARAPFVSGGSHYYIQQLSVHAKYSLPLQDDVLGVPQATRYLSPGVTIAASSFDGALYKVVAVALLTIALAALATRRRRSALALLPAVLIAWLLASGPNGPIGPVYLALYHHLPFFSFLRVPNRWLMVSTLGLSMLTALTIASLREMAFDRERSRRSREFGARVVVLAACLGLFAGSYGLIHGLPTRKPPADYAEAYSTLRADHQDWRILTTPYYQSWMDSRDQPGFPVIYASDLGHTSTYWHAHPGLDRGGWDPRAARFATYLSELTEQGTSRSLTKLLGAVGVKYVGVDPHRAMEVVSGQNPFFERQAGLSQVERAGNVRIYRNRYALPQGFHVGTSCLISGGFQVLGNLAEQPSFRFDRVGVRFADQIAALNGRGALASALASSSCLILAPGGRQALVAQLAAVDVQSVANFAPHSWTRSDTSPSLDIGAEPSLAVTVPRASRLTTTLDAPRAGRYRVDVVGMQAPGQGAVTLRVDGRSAGRAELDSDFGSGYRWLHGSALTLAAGPHKLELFKDGAADALLTKVALVDDHAAARGLPSSPGLRVIRERGAIGPASLHGAVPGRPLLRSAWHADPAPGFVEATRARGSGLDLRVARPGRRYFTLAHARARGAIDPFRPLALRFKGTGSGQTFYLNITFDKQGRRLAWYRFRDSTSVERTLVFSPLQPTNVSSVPDWSSVKQFRIATNSKQRLPGSLRIDGPYELGRPTLKASFADGRRSDPFGDAPAGTDALAPPAQTISDRAAFNERLSNGMLVLTQAYHPDWELQARQGHATHTIALGFANGYSIDQPLVGASARFTAARYGRIGTWISLAVWLIGLVFLAGAFWRNRSRHGPP